MKIADNKPMQQAISLKPQDVALLAKLLLVNSEDWRQIDIASDLFLSQGEIAKSLSRLQRAGLVRGKKAVRASALELLVHAIKYVFPAELGPVSFGIPTASSAPAFKFGEIEHSLDTLVWASSEGEQRGQSIMPLYDRLPQAALRDPEFYNFMAAIELLRVGRARERKMGEQVIAKILKG